MKRKFLLPVLLVPLVVSCSVVRSIPDGEYLLRSSKVEIERSAAEDGTLHASALSDYMQQQPNSTLFGWNPFMSVYGWSDGSGKGINALWEKIGTRPVLLDSSSVAMSAAAMESRLEYLGYYDARVRPLIERKGKKAYVSYRVHPGRRHVVDSIVFDVPGGEFMEDFLADSANVTLRPGMVLSEASLEKETNRGAAYFRDLGYYDFNKNNYFFEADTLSSKTILHYRIRPYTRNELPDMSAVLSKYRIGDVTVSYPSEIHFRESMLKNYNTIYPGDVYSESTVNTAYYRFSSLNVFSGVNVEMSPADSAVVDCNISLSGSDVTGFKLNTEAYSNSTGLLGFSPRLTFFHKNIFKGGEWLTAELLGNWQVKPGTDVKSTELGVSVTLSFPKALGYSLAGTKGRNIPRTEFKFSYNYQNRPEYRRNIASFSYGYSGQVGSRWFYQVYPLQVNLAKLYDVSEDFSGTIIINPYLWDSFFDKLDMGVGGTLYYTTDSDIVPKTSYSYVRMSADLAGNVISLFDPILPFADELEERRLLFGLPYARYVKASLSLGRTFRFGHNDRQALALRLDVGAGKAYGNSTAMPFEKQFYCGGAGSMRGWQVRSLGPGNDPANDFFIIPNQTGDAKFELDAEYRFPLVWKLEGALFAETGNVWQISKLNEFRFDSLAADWGVGLRLNLDFILLRIDGGFRLHDPAREAGSRWLRPSEWFARDGFAIHFGVGYPF